jgi:hypothetical protein
LARAIRCSGFPLANVAELARAAGQRSLRSLMIYYEPDASEIAEKLG